MRAPPDPNDNAFQGNEEDSDAEGHATSSNPPGAFPEHDYGSGSSYY